MSVSNTGDGDLREHLSAFRPLLALSMVMTETSDEDDHRQFLVGVLVQQPAAALTNARLHAKQRLTAEWLQTTNLALERSADEAARCMAAARRSLAIHDSGRNVSDR